MAIGKLPVKQSHFKSLPFAVEKNRRKQVLITSPAIDWAALSEEESRSQWMRCTNTLWEEERESKISYDDLRPYFYEYLAKSGHSKSDIANIKKLRDTQIQFNIISLAFLLLNGAKDAASEAFFKSRVGAFIHLGKQIVEEQKEAAAEKPRKTVQQAMADQYDEIIADMENMQDELKGGFLKWFQQTNMPKAHVDGIYDFYKPRYDELIEAQKGKDDQLKEAYAPYRAKQIKAMLSWYKELFDDLDAYKRVKQAARKVRTRKPVSPTKLVAKLNFMQSFAELKLESIKAETILHKNMLWTYNTKTRKIGVYVASDVDKELTVKGSTIIGWDPKLSICKTLRKPDEQIKTFMGGGKVAVRNFMKGIKATEGKLNGRINKDIILLKVF